MTKSNIKILVIWFALLGTLLFMVSCGGSKKPINSNSIIIKDSTETIIKFRKRDTTITIPGDTLNIKVPFHQLTTKPLLFKSGTQKANVSLSEDDVLNIDCITEEVDRLFELVDTFKTSLKTYQSIKNETIVVPQLYVPWYIKILAWIGGILLFILATTFITKTFIK